MRRAHSALAAVLLCLVLAAPALAARSLDKNSDRCDDDKDCRRSEACVRGECVELKEDGKSCSDGDECESGVCRQQWWPPGRFCTTPCKADKDCPRSRPICNSQNNNRLAKSALTLEAQQATTEGVAVLAHDEDEEQDEQDEQREQDEQEEEDEDDDDDDEEEDDDDEDDDELTAENDHDGDLDSKKKKHDAKKDKKKHSKKHKKDSKKKHSKKHKKDKKDDDDDDQQGGTCVECTEDKDCKKDYYCERPYLKGGNTCKALGAKCAAYGDCGAGEYCDNRVGRCRPYYFSDAAAALFRALGLNPRAAA